MHTTTLLTESLTDLKNVLKVIQNEPHGIVPEKQIQYFIPAVEDCFTAIDILNLKLREFERYFGKSEKEIALELSPNDDITTQNKREARKIVEKTKELEKALFDAGLLDQTQMKFKHSIHKQTFSELAQYLNIPWDTGINEDELEKFYKKHYPEEYEIIKNQKGNDQHDEGGKAKNQGKKRWYSFIKNIKWDTVLPKLKTYLGSSKVVIGSLAKVFGLTEKVSEVLGMLGVGITMVEEVRDFRKKKKEKKKKD
ncbi:MAG: hypothetical protein DWQ02_06700 [Bacteroidetes bacterium]|nr:MAG: hypothetical protein DWQ02_06700 [Bacteroidota bacterium]